MPRTCTGRCDSRVGLSHCILAGSKGIDEDGLGMDEPGRLERSMRESTPEITPVGTRVRSGGAVPRRVLVLTSGLGYGHRRACDATVSYTHLTLPTILLV